MLVFKAKISGDGGPVGVLRGQAPLESEVIYHLKRFLAFTFVETLHYPGYTNPIKKGFRHSDKTNRRSNQQWKNQKKLVDIPSTVL